MKNKIFLSLGSNIGNRKENIISALSFLESSGFVKINKISSFYETSPVGPKQMNFYNIVVEALTILPPGDLLRLVKRTEEILGRKFSHRWTARLIDIDILFYNNKIQTTANVDSRFRGNDRRGGALTIPHKEISNRLFVLIPMAEIATDFVHPVLNKKIGRILEKKLLTLGNQKVRIISK
ncbi:MAG: 2-amino-4-hydroxy-6-hydroxymethyldihydropteridine diphosphokinase [Endomicrobia bacterium]|nr:2-amino-4-hydroxy-6-hydroxymethyldihydropteridine diphosphokinase [Endomicrobiia bacterium]MCL2799311.1 2-amino-4-hydroxy-6-hydroxymethyldihydropteridine diphosphokinase [Endomicrobiia bacterium]